MQNNIIPDISLYTDVGKREKTGCKDKMALCHMFLF